MLKIRINHTHLSQIKKKRKEKNEKWNHKKQRKVKTYKPRNVALNKKRNVVFIVNMLFTNKNLHRRAIELKK